MKKKTKLILLTTILLFIISAPVYAKTDWTINFMPNNGKFSDGSMDMKTITVSTDSDIGNTVEIPSKIGYTFEGWFDSNDKMVYNKDGKASTGEYWDIGKWKRDNEPSTVLTLYAKYTPNDYVVKYSPNGAVGAVVGQAAVYDTNIIVRDNPFTRTNYKFMGWNTKADGSDRMIYPGEKISNLATSGYVTLYAQWSRSDATIKFAPNGGTGRVEGSMPDMTVTISEKTEMPECGFKKYTASGESTFLGWTFNSKSSEVYEESSIMKPGSLVEIISDVTLYAVWDDYPNFDYAEVPNRYFTLEDAHNGVITEENLLSTVHVSDNGKTLPTVLKKNYIGGPGVTLVDFDPREFLEWEGEGGISVRYKAVDSAGHVTYLDIMVYMVNNLRDSNKFTLRTVSPKYYDKSNGAALSDTWYHDKSALIKEAFDSHSSVAKYVIPKDNVKEIKDVINGAFSGTKTISEMLQSHHTIWNNILNYLKTDSVQG